MPRYSSATSAFVAMILFSWTSTQVRAQRPPENQPDMTIDESVRVRVIDSVRKALNDDYVFPDVATKMDEAIRNRVKNKEYDGIKSAKGLATGITDHLQAISHDKHLRVFYSHEPIPKRPEGQREPTTQDRDDAPPRKRDQSRIREGGAAGRKCWPNRIQHVLSCGIRW